MSTATSKPRVLFVSGTRYRLPLGATLARKWDALAAELELRVLAKAVDGSGGNDERFVLVSPSTGASFWILLPVRVVRLLRSFGPEVVVTQSPYEAAAALVARRVTRSPARALVRRRAGTADRSRRRARPRRRRRPGSPGRESHL